MTQKMKKHWLWLAMWLAGGLLVVLFLLAQIGSGETKAKAESAGSNNRSEVADSALLIEAMNTGDYQTALEILHDYGVAEDTLLEMATRLGKPPQRVGLQEPFLRGTDAMSLRGQTGDDQEKFYVAGGPGYERPYWIAGSLYANWVVRYDAELANCPLPPIAVLNAKLNDPRFIEYFKWYDRYAEQLHSVVLTGKNMNNTKLKSGYDQANRQLNALFQLIKARKPDAFVWLGVVKQDDRTDEAWLKAMTFHPDGLQIGNLTQFHSPFAGTRDRYLRIVGADTALMVMGFLGYKDALREVDGKMAVDKTAAASPLREIGGVMGDNLWREEQHLAALGYRGLGVHRIMLQSLHEAKKNGGQKP